MDYQKSEFMASGFATYFLNLGFREARTCPAPQTKFWLLIFLGYYSNIIHLQYIDIHNIATFSLKINQNMHFLEFFPFFKKGPKFEGPRTR